VLHRAPHERDEELPAGARGQQALRGVLERDRKFEAALAAAW
jgi:hypothetical protein